MDYIRCKYCMACWCILGPNIISNIARQRRHSIDFHSNWLFVGFFFTIKHTHSPRRTHPQSHTHMCEYSRTYTIIYQSTSYWWLLFSYTHSTYITVLLYYIFCDHEMPVWWITRMCWTTKLVLSLSHSEFALYVCQLSFCAHLQQKKCVRVPQRGAIQHSSTQNII